MHACMSGPFHIRLSLESSCMGGFMPVMQVNFQFTLAEALYTALLYESYFLACNLQGMVPQIQISLSTCHAVGSYHCSLKSKPGIFFFNTVTVLASTILETPYIIHDKGYTMD